MIIKKKKKVKIVNNSCLKKSIGYIDKYDSCCKASIWICYNLENNYTIDSKLYGLYYEMNTFIVYKIIFISF